MWNNNQNSRSGIDGTFLLDMVQQPQKMCRGIELGQFPVLQLRKQTQQGKSFAQVTQGAGGTKTWNLSACNTHALNYPACSLLPVSNLTTRQEVKVKVKVAQSCPTLCDPMDYTVHGILRARVLEWVAFPFSRRSSQCRDRTRVSFIAGRFFTNRTIRERGGANYFVSYVLFCCYSY